MLLDTTLPGLGSVASVRVMVAACPRSRVVALSGHPDSREAHALERAGAVGYLPKSATRETLVSAVRAALRGESQFPALESPRSAESDLPASGQVFSGPLSQREQQVLSAIAEGRTNKQIAARLGIGVRTVETHRQNLMRKLDVQGTAALTRWAIARGVVDPRR